MPICPTSAETGAEHGGAGFGLPTPANFKLRGLSAGLNIGVSKMCATGDVYDLKQIGQFPGTYTKLDASVALGGGLGGLRLKNENGVIMTLHSRTAGADLNLGTVSGVTVTMEK